CRLVEELAARGRCETVALGPLAPEAVAEYLEARLPGAELPPDAAALLHERTGGNALFVEKVVDGWIEAGLLEPHDGGWTLVAGADDLAALVPDSLRRLVEREVSWLPDDDR